MTLLILLIRGRLRAFGTFDTASAYTFCEEQEEAMAAKNRGHGTGGVYTRPDGRLVARIMIDGKRHAHYVRTKQEGYSWLAKMRRDHELGITAITERQTLERFIATWLDMIKPTIRPSTLKRYEELTRLHVLPTLGKTQLAKLSPLQLQQLYKRKRDEDLSPTTVRYIHVTVHSALKAAMRMGLVQRNVADLTLPPQKAEYEGTALTVDQLKTFLSTAKGDRLEALYVLVMSTGMRSGGVTLTSLAVRRTFGVRCSAFTESSTSRSRRQHVAGAR
ncbi:MAG: hypothetical protein C5B60_09270 [Chloroflexi bacterium]|nr:MAG: hypothetical protein C5B60_09270 [Chloroflexota bacterium]